MNLELILMSENDIAEFKKNVQCAFQKGFEDVFGKCEETILPEKDIDQSLNGKGSVAYERWGICRIGTGSGRIREGSQVGVLYAFLWAFFIGVFMGHHEIYNESRKGNHDRDSPLIGSYFLCVEVLMLEELKFSIQSIFSGNGIKI